MTQRESRLSTKILAALREVGVFCFKVHGNEHTMAGLPDIICCVDGLFVSFEVKHPETAKNTSPRQKYVHELIRQAKGTATVVTSPAGALAIVAAIRAAAKT